MKKIFILLMLSLFFSMKFVSLNALEQTGLGVYDYTALSPFEDNKHIIIKRTTAIACDNALKKYVDTFDSAKKTNFKKIEEQIKKNISKYMQCGDNIVDQNADIVEKKFSIAVKANIDEKAINEAIIQSSSLAKTTDDASEIMIYFVVRAQDKIIKKKDRVINVKKTKKSSDTSASEAENEGELELSETTTDTVVTEEGGSVIESSEKIVWKIQDGYEDAISSSFEDSIVEAGYELIPSFDIDAVSELQDAIKSAYSENDQLPSKLRKKISLAVAEEEIPFYIMGTFDVGKKETDSATGLVVANVTMNAARIYELKEKNGKIRTKTKASVASIQRKGKGSTEKEAITNAIVLAAKAGAEKLMQKMIKKDIQ